MPTIWLCGGFGWLAALPGSKFEVRRSTFDVQPPPLVGSMLSTARIRRVSGDTPRQQARRYGGSREAVRRGSGGGPMWIAQDCVSTPLRTLTFWLWESLSAPCVDGAAPAQARRVPHVDCANHWH